MMNTSLSTSCIIDMKYLTRFKKRTTPTEIWKSSPRHHAVRGLRHLPGQPHYWKSALYCRSVLKVYFYSSKNLENHPFHHIFDADNILEWAVLRDSSPKRNGGATSVETRFFASPPPTGMPSAQMGRRTGCAHVEGTSTHTAMQPFKYGAKELDMTHAWHTYDFGARIYDPTLARWLSPDPMMEKYYDISPYGYCHNDPAHLMDWDGMDDWYDKKGYFIGKDYNESDEIVILGV